jgi:hypothetical protein
LIWHLGFDIWISRGFHLTVGLISILPGLVQEGLTSKSMITIAFSSHHAETLPFAGREMARHELIVLEEPPSPKFSSMLEGRVSIDEYMLESESAFPAFERHMSELLQGLHSEGKKIVQVEPYLERLMEIHEHFANGIKPEEVMKMPGLSAVYKAEKAATGALIRFYAASVNAPFSRVIETVKSFALEDAKRLTLRAELRARAIANLRYEDRETYVEAGYIHYPLYLFLRRQLGEKQRIRVVYLMQPVLKAIGAKRRNMGSGDVLTLHYALHGAASFETADLLAARSLIYIKLIQKEELLPGDSDAPHSEDELLVNGLVERLGYEDCERLYEETRFAKREKALEVVGRYLKSGDLSRPA